jgi:hypothetical protein
MWSADIYFRSKKSSIALQKGVYWLKICIDYTAIFEYSGLLIFVLIINRCS